jgi:predicted DNA binding CopG/RHH family protein
MEKKIKKEIDDLEEEIVSDFEKGKFISVDHEVEEMRMAKEGAMNYLKKEGRINIRLSKADLNSLKRKAVQEGIPYQTLISSILHKFVSGSLSTKR